VQAGKRRKRASKGFNIQTAFSRLSRKELSPLDGRGLIQIKLTVLED
jgi:hypothetical protein